jgi:hypothetical protein
LVVRDALGSDMGDDRELYAIVCALTRYVSANPLASDTPEGIYRWWLGPDECSMDQLLRALAWMKGHGLMDEQVALDGRARYRRSANDAELKRTLEDCARAAALRH